MEPNLEASVTEKLLPWPN